MTLNAWHTGVVCALDFESTGVDATQERIVTACLLEIHPGGRIHEQQWLINPGIPIPAGAAAIHGITTEKAQADGREPGPVLVELMDRLSAIWQAGWPVVGHNLGGYDLTLLEHELHRNSLGCLRDYGGPGFVIDTLAIDKALRPRVSGKGARKLDACATAYKVTLDQAHDAKYDAVAAARIAWRMCNAYPEQLQRDLHDLQEAQAWTHRKWAEEFEAYLRTRGSADVINRDWPVTLADSNAEQVPA